MSETEQKGMFEKAWDNLKEAIGQANIELERATTQANENYKKAIAPYRKAVRQAAAKEDRDFWEATNQ